MVFKIIQEFVIEKGEGIIILSNFGSVLLFVKNCWVRLTARTLDSNMRDSMVGRHMHGGAC